MDSGTNSIVYHAPALFDTVNFHHNTEKTLIALDGYTECILIVQNKICMSSILLDRVIMDPTVLTVLGHQQSQG